MSQDSDTGRTPAFETRGLTIQAGGKQILSDVTFTVAPGESVSIIGPNGAGKTTLLKCLGGIIPGGEKSVFINGRPLGRYLRRNLARVLSYVPQADGRSLPFPVSEFVLMARYAHQGAFAHLTTHDREAARNAMERAGVAHLADRVMDTLSGGERQKVFIAAALAQGAQALLLDEPTTFLDYKHQADLLDLIRDMYQVQGLTIMTVTHDVNHGALSSTHVLALKEGRQVFWGTPEALLNPGILQEIYETPFDLLVHPSTKETVVITARGIV